METVLPLGPLARLLRVTGSNVITQTTFIDSGGESAGPTSNVKQRRRKEAEVGPGEREGGRKPPSAVSRGSRRKGLEEKWALNREGCVASAETE